MIRGGFFVRSKAHSEEAHLNDRMALSLLAEVMGWPEDDQAVATHEYAWLRMMSAVKYDGYSYFRAGVRFLESLATWLKQFDPGPSRCVRFHQEASRLYFAARDAM